MPDTELSMGYLLNWGARLVRRLGDRRLKDLGLSVAHLPVINALAEKGAMSQKALAAYAAYVINATQFVLKLRAARLEQPGADVPPPATALGLTS